MLTLPRDRPVVCFANLMGLSVHDRANYLLDLLPDTTLIPTYSYSYTNGESYSIASPVRSGALGAQALRRGWNRTMDPIFSFATRINLPSKFITVDDVNCFGAQSLWAWLLEQQAYIALLGTNLNSCTAVHHIERKLGVPYRMDKIFLGLTYDRQTRATYFCRVPEARRVTELSRLELKMQLTYSEHRKWSYAVFPFSKLEDAIVQLLNEDIYGLTARL